MTITTLKVGALDTNCYILSDGVSPCCGIIDPGGDAERIRRTVRQAGVLPQCILLTHGHYDHTGAVSQLLKIDPGLPVYLHEMDADAHDRLYHFIPVETLRYYKEGDTVPIGGLRVSVLETPGHSPGSVSLLAGNNLFCGDALFSGSCGRTDFPGGSSASLNRSLRRLGRLDGNFRLFPGHMAPSDLDTERKSNPFLRRALHEVFA